MAVCVPMDLCYQYLGTEFVSLMISLGIIVVPTNSSGNEGNNDDNAEDLAIPYCHIMPVNIQQHQMTTTTTTKTLYVATDLHPNVLATCTIGKNDNDQAVMYIGPDSLALVDHYYNNNLNDASSSSSSTFREEEKIVDIGSGSGIQALHLAAARLSSSSSSLPCCCHVTSIDINPRALEFTRLNFEWNGLNPPKLILGDITKPYKKNGHLYDHDDENDDENDDAKEMSLSWEDILQNATTIVANPPFLPVPIHDDWNISKQHGYFSSGGASGDVILRRIIELASQTLSSKCNGTLAIVSEFMNPQTEFPSKFQSWWESSSSSSSSSSNDSKSSSSSRGGSSSDGGGGGGGCAVLFTNAEPLDAKTYASRRGASSVEEEQQWMLHLQQEKITEVSPGLLFVQTNKTKKKMQFHHHLIPKTELGSLWTPTNWKAREITRDILKSHYWR
eukprot:scaffold22565_cov97-Cylindrotheca_fusiformis.AAC.4